MPRYYSAIEAAKRLGVSRNTLYAYVSRGMIRSEPGDQGKRTRRYHAQDVERLAKKSEIYKAPERALNKAVDWGAPILESAITLIGDENFYYRGKPVLVLADQYRFEETIELLWQAERTLLLQPQERLKNFIEKHLLQTLPSPEPVDAFLTVLSTLNSIDHKAYSFSKEATIQAGTLMLGAFIKVLTGRWPTNGVANFLCEHWGITKADEKLIDAALTLAADHEFNISSFTARCTASAGCSPYSSIAAASHAFWGRRHGGNTERIYGLLNEADGQNSLYEAISSRVRRGEHVPGFGHKLYDRDPRAKYLLNHLPDNTGYIAQALSVSQDILDGLYPTIDFALVMLEKELSLPKRSGAYIFYYSRIAGWNAHIIEQYSQNRPIRPRARYTGVQPASFE